MLPNIVDLESLVLMCRDPSAKIQMSEAVKCYQVGAYRSAIIATWIAVVIDIISKLREIAATGDTTAQELVDHLSAKTSSHDINALLSFERDLLEKAMNAFQLIGRHEYNALNRLKDDRNASAHPSLNGDGELYYFSAELTRSHMHSAVTLLLSQYPVQGKKFITLILKTIESDTFPAKPDDSERVLGRKYLRRPSAALLRNLTIALITWTISQDASPPTDSDQLFARQCAALQALWKLHPNEVHAAIREWFEQKSSQHTSDTNKLRKIIWLIFEIPDLHQFLDDTTIIQMKTQVKSPGNDLNLFLPLLHARHIPALETGASDVILGLNINDFVSLCKFFARKTSPIANRTARSEKIYVTLCSRCLSLLRDAKSYVEAIPILDTCADLLTSRAPSDSLSQDFICEIHNCADSNPNVSGCYTYQKIPPKQKAGDV